jgi:DNA repair photolyase
MKKYRVVYEPKGAAREYSELACNLFIGCNHGCKYCYAPACMFKSKEQYNENIKIRSNVINKLQKDLIDMSISKDTRRVLLCFITDPYQGNYSFNKITAQALGLFKAYNIPMQVLTKGGMKAVRDFHLYKKNDAYASTLTFFDERKSLEWEPLAATPEDRIKSLKKAKEKNIETWVSFEPVIEPEETYKLFEHTKDFVDLYKIGKINRYKNFDKNVDWHRFTYKIIEMCAKNNKKYYIKNSLKKYM